MRAAVETQGGERVMINEVTYTLIDVLDGWAPRSVARNRYRPARSKSRRRKTTERRERRNVARISYYLMLSNPILQDLSNLPILTDISPPGWYTQVKL